MRYHGRGVLGAAIVLVLGVGGCGVVRTTGSPARRPSVGLAVATPSARAATPSSTPHSGRRPAARPLRTVRVRPDDPLGTLTGTPGHGPFPVGAVGLTFDDGPDPTWTPQVLAVLARFHAHATFFDIGEHVRDHPSLVRAEFLAGDGVGNHTETHPDLTRLSPRLQADQIEAAAAAIRSATGHTPDCLRPPYDAVDASLEEVTAQQHEALMLYDVDTRDWSLPGVGAIVARALARARPGAVIDLHDAGGDRSETLAALPLILRGLQQRHLVPVAFCRA